MPAGQSHRMSEPLFGFGAHPGIEHGAELLRLVRQADQDGLDLFSLSDHPYQGDRLDAYATIAFMLGATRSIAGFANVTSLPTRPAPMLARTVTSLSALSAGRIVLGVGAGGRLDRVTEMGAPHLSPAEAVAEMEESILTVRRLSAGGAAPPTAGTDQAESDRAESDRAEPGRARAGRARADRAWAAEPAPVAAPAVWTGSVGPRSLAVTGRAADGWIPGHAADWLSPRYRESRPIIDEAAESAGRDPREVITIFNFPGRITDRPVRETRDADGRWIGGSVSQWVEELAGAVLDHRAAGFMLFSPTSGTPDQATLRLWATEIAPAVRERAL
jgi:alkanesulfonate monooxygenase SsuD/methylene tetrahydromethanopterin reductase-like flavin-dependent oxidoreductase (luciferase family)